jgi:hypothetical protein
MSELLQDISILLLAIAFVWYAIIHTKKTR